MPERRFQETLRVPSYLCGRDDTLGFDGAASLLQEAAWQHARRLGFAFDEADTPIFWVLHRVRMNFRRPPRWNEMVTITTWPSGIDRLYALREVRIDGADGARLIDITSAWVILDAVRRRPVRPGRHLPEDRIIPERLIELPAPRSGAIDPIDPERVAGQLETARWHEVRPSDTDRNDHVNNVRYIQWLIDAAPTILDGAAEGVVSFLAETRVGQEYAVVDDPQRGIAEVWTRGADGEANGAATGEAAPACRFHRGA